MQIALYSHAPNNPDGGASRVYHLLEQGLRDRGHDVRAMHLEDLGVPSEPRMRLAVQRLAMPQYLSRRAWADRRPEDDVVMSSSGMAYPLFRRMGGLTGRRPLLVNHVHGAFAADHVANTSESIMRHRRTSMAYRAITGPVSVRWDRAGMTAADLSIVQNLRDVGDVRDTVSDPTAVEWINASVHPEILQAGEAAPVMGVRPAGAVLWFGTWESRKGSHYVPHAFRALRAVHPNAHLTIGGTGMTTAEVRGAFAEEDRSSVTVLGRITRSEHISLMERNSIFLFPSLSEGFGLALVEALSMGLAGVTTNTAFGGDHLTDGRTARIVPATSEHIGRALIQLVGDDDLRRELAERGREVARSFTLERQIDEYERVFSTWRPRVLEG